jgi:hypothetical protein
MHHAPAPFPAPRATLSGHSRRICSAAVSNRASASIMSATTACPRAFTTRCTAGSDPNRARGSRARAARSALPDDTGVGRLRVGHLLTCPCRPVRRSGPTAVCRVGVEWGEHRACHWHWTYPSGGGFRVNYEVRALDPTRYGMRLHYTWPWTSTGQVDSADYTVNLTTTRPRFGGRRWWFVCPLLVNGRGCYRRVGKLYLPPRARYFGCRGCHELTYAHQSSRGQRPASSAPATGEGSRATSFASPNAAPTTRPADPIDP